MTVLVARESSYGTIGVCTVVENPSLPDNAANMLAPYVDVANFFHDHGWKFSDPVVPKIVQSPKHGTLMSLDSDVFAYQPNAHYFGPERVTALARIGEKSLRIEYFMYVMQFVPSDDEPLQRYKDGLCPSKLRVWSIK